MLNKIKKINILFFYIYLFILPINFIKTSAATIDNSKPIIITADKFEIDYKNKYAAYFNNVELQQGTRKLIAANIYIYFKENKINNIIASNDNNKLVEYSEYMDQKQGKIYAKAQKFIFEPNINQITLKQNAIITQGGRQLVSEVIYYDLKKQIAYMPKVKDHRTKIILN